MAVEGQRPDQDEKNIKKAPGALFQLVTIGATLVASTFVGLAIGFYLDRYFDTGPWLTIICLLIGITSGFYNIYKMAKRYGSPG
ncbi:MAG: AtpZ/AtpI family protein [Thermodesulfobacteriota bacterium]